MTPRQRISAALTVLHAEIGTLDVARARLVEASRQLRAVLDCEPAPVVVPEGVATFTCVDCGGVFEDHRKGGCPRLRCAGCFKKRHAARELARYHRIKGEGVAVGEEEGD